MPECIIAGTVVKFPFEPYDVQRAYMEKVIMCLRDSTNGVLESPTGTGKTLSLLCSSLAWLLAKKEEELRANNIQTATTTSNPDDDKQNEQIKQKLLSCKVPKIIYASRTHSQLAQAVKELKRTSYSSMKAVVLGSRDQLCIHPEVMQEREHVNKIQMCKYHVLTRKCSFLSRLESCKSDSDFCASSIMDIEDLVKVGQKLKMCPYFAAKQLVEETDIVFMPYNYLFDPSARQANKIQMSNAICILDEAHNIEKICEESASTQITSTDVAMAIEDIIQVLDAISREKIDVKKYNLDIEVNDLVSLKKTLLNFGMSIDNIEVRNKNEGATFPAAYIFDLLARANINFGSSNVIIELLDKLVQLMVMESQNNHLLRKGGSFQKFAKLLITVFNCDEENMDKVQRSFKVHVQFEEPDRGDVSLSWAKRTKAKATKIVNYWCFNPGFGMGQLLRTNPRSVILTSGTLAPLNPLIAELCLPVAQRLENPHIVPASHVFCKIINSGPDREQLISNYQNRDNPKYIHSLGSTILNVARIVPDGLLVFFPSYPLLNQCVNSWRASGLWDDILRYKPTFIEPRGKDDFIMTMESFYDNIKDSKGACFMAVCRGKVSEGLDFVDRNGRAVIITGLPFPPLRDPKIMLKKKYLEENRTTENELLTGAAWYSLEATRAVNQAIGRVIRHRNDYGAILLCDKRFQQPSQVKQLSKWVRELLGTAPKSSVFGPVVKELKDFFKNAEKTVLKCQNYPLMSDRLQESQAEILQSKCFSDSKELLGNDIKFQNVHSEIIVIEDEEEHKEENSEYNAESPIIDNFLYSKYIAEPYEGEGNQTKFQNDYNKGIIIDEEDHSVPSPNDSTSHAGDNIKSSFDKDDINLGSCNNCSPPETSIKIEYEEEYYECDAESPIIDNFLYSKYVPESDEAEGNRTKFQNDYNQAIIIDEACHSVPSPNDSMPTTGDDIKISSDKDVTDLPSCDNCSPPETSHKINKRDQSALSQFHISTSSAAINVKKIKVEPYLSSTPSMRTISPPPSPSSSSSYTQTQSVNRTIPECRVEFLNLLRKTLSPEDFAEFTAALLNYKHNDTIHSLLDLLFRLLGQPDLLHLLHSMRRFLKVQHRHQFDERIADLCCVPINDEDYQ